MAVLMGVDLGQKRDPSALCVLETTDRVEGETRKRHYLVRFLERLPLGTPYPEVAQRVAEVVQKTRQQTGQAPELAVDATGVGAPIIDLLQERSELSPTAVYFTHGDRRKETWQDGCCQVSLGKAFLVSRLQALLQTQRLHLPKGSEPEALAHELRNYEIRVDENANDRYGAFRVGTHDDLVTALGLAVQADGLGRRVWQADPEIVRYNDKEASWQEIEGRRQNLPNLGVVRFGAMSTVAAIALLDWDHGLGVEGLEKAPRLWVDFALELKQGQRAQLASRLLEAQDSRRGKRSFYAVPNSDPETLRNHQKQLYREGVSTQKVWPGAAERFQAEKSIGVVGKYLQSGLLRVHQFQTDQLLQAIELGEWDSDNVLEHPADAWRQPSFAAFGEVVCWLVYLARLHRPREPSYEDYLPLAPIDVGIPITPGPSLQDICEVIGGRRDPANWIFR